MIRSCQWGEERRLTNTFSSNLKTVNKNIFSNYGGIKTSRKHWLVQRIMKVFLLEFNSYYQEVSKVVSCSAFMLTLTLGILFEKLTAQIGDRPGLRTQLRSRFLVTFELISLKCKD